MNPTSLSLLDRLKVARPDASDWNRLQGVDLPLIPGWLGRVPGLGDDSADLAQEVLVFVSRENPRFDRQRDGSFRAWLRQVTVNTVRDDRRQRQRRPAVGLIRPTRSSNDYPTRTTASPGSGTGTIDKHVVEKRLAIVQIDFNPTTRQALRRFGVDGEPAGKVAGEPGISENAVILAKSLVLKRLRQEAGDLWA